MAFVIPSIPSMNLSGLESIGLNQAFFQKPVNTASGISAYAAGVTPTQTATKTGLNWTLIAIALVVILLLAVIIRRR